MYIYIYVFMILMSIACIFGFLFHLEDPPKQRASHADSSLRRFEVRSGAQ